MNTVSSGAFRLLWLGQTVSVIGDGAAILVVPLVVLQATGDPLIAALAAAPRTIAYLLIGLLAGPLADRWNSRRVLIMCDLVRVGLFALMPLAIHMPHGPLLVLLLACAAAGAGVFFEVSLAKTVQALLRPEDLVTGNARLEMSSQLGLLLGPALTGAVIALIGVEQTLWINAGTFLVSVVTLVPLRLGGTGEPPARRPILREMTEGFAFIRSNSVIAWLVSTQAVVNFVVAAETLVIYHASVGLKASAAWIGVIVAAAGVGGIVATSLASRAASRFTPAHLIGWSVISLGGTLLAFALSFHPLVLLFANFLHGGVTIFASVHIRALRQQLVPAEILGRVTANARMLAFVANPAGAAVFGLIAGLTGQDARWSFTAAALLSLVSGALAYRGLITGTPGRGRDEITPQPEPPAR
ncbi:MFS transporter [Streptosporangium algeriense]|uniref:MFS transporter n=1 Tax=Streptosporangium algeriense TaxID=1682748 RepID=A0ABW3DKJ9_9ACTN